MRQDSPFVLAFAGTMALHVLIVVIAHAMLKTQPLGAAEIAPEIEMVDIEVPPPPPPPPPPETAPAPPSPPQVVPHPAVHTPAPAPAHPTPPPIDPPPVSPDLPAGGDQIVTLPDPPPAATGVGVAVGPTSTGHLGRGGSGGGTGAGSGAGSGDRPVSVATIKTQAMPRGDYGYASIKDYPEEAKQLGVEGQIKVRLIVDEHGQVKSSVLLNRLGHGLDELALARAKAIQFDPARDTDDRPVSSVVVWTFTMALPK